MIVNLVLRHERLCVVHAACFTSYEPITSRLYCNTLVDVQLGGLTKIRVVVQITLKTLYESSHGKSFFPGSKILSEISDSASLFRCFPYSHVATPRIWARREEGWRLVSRPHDVGCNTPVMHRGP